MRPLSDSPSIESCRHIIADLEDIALKLKEEIGVLSFQIGRPLAEKLMTKFGQLSDTKTDIAYMPNRINDGINDDTNSERRRCLG